MWLNMAEFYCPFIVGFHCPVIVRAGASALGDTLQSFVREGSAPPGPTPYPFLYTTLTEKVPLSYTPLQNKATPFRYS